MRKLSIFTKKRTNLQISKDSFIWATAATAALSIEELLNTKKYTDKEVSTVWNAIFSSAVGQLEKKEESGLIKGYILGDLTNKSVIKAVNASKLVTVKKVDVSKSKKVIEIGQELSTISGKYLANKNQLVNYEDIGRIALPILARPILEIFPSNVDEIGLFHLTLTLTYARNLSEAINQIELYGNAQASQRISLLSAIIASSTLYFIP